MVRQKAKYIICDFPAFDEFYFGEAIFLKMKSSSFPIRSAGKHLF